ncbi:MAG: recombinase family protein [Defluviitaleaceae bacterium]|nr:recombinase family protein [Defluviitaleaceae bacterium]
MKTYGYVRVSSKDQQDCRQFIAMESHGIPPEHIFSEKQSGKDIKRPELQSLMDVVQRDDVVVVESISRFARNTRDLLALVEKLTTKGVEFISLREHIDTTTPTGRFMLTVFAAVAELERDFILQRQAEGIAAAKARGVKFGRPCQKVPDNFYELAKLHQRGKLTVEEFLRESGLTKSTLYRRLREWKVANTK